MTCNIADIMCISNGLFRLTSTYTYDRITCKVMCDIKT